MMTKIQVPFEWMFKKTLSPLFEEFGEDIKKLYATWRDLIITKTYNKIIDKDDNKILNLRITRDIFWSGSYSDELICAEYFGWILASSRTIDWKDDGWIHYVETIKWLSSKQLLLHYIIYNSLNKIFLTNKLSINVRRISELKNQSIVFSKKELCEKLQLNIDIDLNILCKQWLLQAYEYDTCNLDWVEILSYVVINPSTFWILLYAVAHNKLENWQDFSNTLFEDFEDILLPDYFEESIGALLKKLQTP